MAEPTTSAAGISIVALAIALLGPLAGPYALIFFAALAGSLWPLSAAATATRVDGAWLVLRCTLTSVVLTGGAAAWLQSEYKIQVDESIGPVAFAFGALGNGWRTVIDALADALSSALKYFGGRA